MSSLSTNGSTLPVAPNRNLIEKYAGYDSAASTKSKIAFILKKENKFLHIRQIAKILHSLEPKIEEKEFISKLYPAMGDLRKTGAIAKASVGTSNVNTFWGSKNWLDENGNVKEEHKYDEDQVTVFGSNDPIEI